MITGRSRANFPRKVSTLIASLAVADFDPFFRRSHRSSFPRDRERERRGRDKTLFSFDRGSLFSRSISFPFLFFSNLVHRRDVFVSLSLYLVSANDRRTESMRCPVIPFVRCVVGKSDDRFLSTVSASRCKQFRWRGEGRGRGAKMGKSEKREEEK